MSDTTARPDVRTGDRIRLYAGQALSAHTLLPLRRDVTLDICHARYYLADGMEITGIVLVGSGAWTRSMADRQVILTPEHRFEVAARIGDTVSIDGQDTLWDVTAIKVHPDGRAEARLRCREDNSRNVAPLFDLTVVSRAETSQT